MKKAEVLWGFGLFAFASTMLQGDMAFVKLRNPKANVAIFKSGSAVGLFIARIDGSGGGTGHDSAGSDNGVLVQANALRDYGVDATVGSAEPIFVHCGSSGEKIDASKCAVRRRKSTVHPESGGFDAKNLCLKFAHRYREA